MSTVIYEASITGLFRLVMILLAAYTVYIIITRYMIPALMRNYIQNFQQRFFEENPHLKERMKQRSEGEITIEKADIQASSRKTNDDEYVDYEEVK